MKLGSKLVGVVAAMALLSGQVALAEDASCKKVHLAEVGWSDIAATTGMATVVLEGLGYKPVVTMASVPIVLAGVKKKQIDVFLGYWSPTMTHMIEPFIKAGDIKVLATPNLVNAKYTLAVPDYLYEKGLKSFADISKFEKDLEGKIHGIEPGDDGNALIAKMIKDNKFGLKNFKLIETSEAGMLIATQRAIKDQKAIVFLGWEPHPMNVQMKMKYLQGGDDVFGPNYGEAKVYTIMPPSFETRCPNATALVKNLQFTPEMENQVMVPIMKKVKPTIAARDYLKKNPAVLDKWLAGVKTFDGKDGLEAVKTALK